MSPTPASIGRQRVSGEGGGEPINGCTTQCEADQSTANGLGGNFQDLLTCIGNANAFPSACYPLACAARSSFIMPPDGCPADGS